MNVESERQTVSDEVRKVTKERVKWGKSDPSHVTRRETTREPGHSSHRVPSFTYGLRLRLNHVHGERVTKERVGRNEVTRDDVGSGRITLTSLSSYPPLLLTHFIRDPEGT